MVFFGQFCRRRDKANLIVWLSMMLSMWLAMGKSEVSFGPCNAWGIEQEMVARVNGEPVFRDELQRFLVDPMAMRQYQLKNGSRDADPEELERLAVQELVYLRLILQEAERLNFTVTEDDLDQSLTALRSRFKDLESFGAWMHERGLDDKSLFSALQDGMLANRVKASLVEGIRVTEEEVRRYYEQHKQDLITGEEVRLRLIAVKSIQDADEILLALKRGESFSYLARTRSLGKLAAQGGDTGWIDALTLPPELKSIVVKLKPGDVGGPLQKADDEFLLVGLQDQRPLRPTSFDSARREIERRLLTAKQQEAIQGWLTEQEIKAQIEVYLQP